MTDPTIQHLRKRVNEETFNEVESGRKTFDVFVSDDTSPEEGDLVTCEEWDVDDRVYTGRKVTRKISHVLNTKDQGYSEELIQRYGVTICSMLQPDFQTLRGIFNSHFITGVIIETNGNEEEPHELIDGPYHLPPFSSPPFYDMGFFDRVGTETWPLGVFDIMLMIRLDVSRDRFMVVDEWVNGAVYTVDEQGVRQIESFPLSVEALKVGKARRLDGREVELAHPEEVKRLHLVEEKVEVDLPPDLVLRDSLGAGVDQEMEQMLQEEGIDYEEDFNVTD